ncbi:MAG: type II toxin-antitoxin system RelE/ParE family toxin [Candidatus Aenigmarchaeota archaeon]|nr:type II toxin-antitoxin system RelE/ParE family toxin [Candidatus Aenigmarchaeota archaeon]
MFEIFISNQAKKFLRGIDRKIAGEMTDVLSFLKATPIPVKDFDVSKLSGEEDSYRIRIGRYRILYRIYWKERKLRIIRIETREAAYD